MRNERLIAALALVLATALGCGGQEPAPTPAPAPAEPPPPPTATAHLTSRADLGVTGTVTFTEIDGLVTVRADVDGAEPGDHGFHLHEVGDCSAEDFTSAGGHFNPTEAPHGGPKDIPRHAGDLGNLGIGESRGGSMEMVTDMLTVTPGPNSVVGRAVILHEVADDLISQPTGAAGGRIACGVVEPGGAEAASDEPAE